MYNKNLDKMNKEQLRMQMLAGVITEGQYKAKLNEDSNANAESLVGTYVEVDHSYVHHILSLESSDDEGVEYSTRRYSPMSDEEWKDMGNSNLYLPYYVINALVTQGKINAWDDDVFYQMVDNPKTPTIPPTTTEEPNQGNMGFNRYSDEPELD